MSILNSYLVTSQLLRPFDPLIHEKYVINTRIIMSPYPTKLCGGLIFLWRDCVGDRSNSEPSSVGGGVAELLFIFNLFLIFVEQISVLKRDFHL